MFRRLITWIRNRLRPEPEPEWWHATVLYGGEIVAVHRADPGEARVEVGPPVMSRQRYLKEHGEEIEHARHQANRTWIAMHAPDEALFR
jgi:hypothetical protein